MPRAVTSPTQPGRDEKISGGAKYLSSFFKFEVKQAKKRRRSKSVTFAVCYFCVIFQNSLIKEVYDRNALRQIYISK